MSFEAFLLGARGALSAVGAIWKGLPGPIQALLIAGLTGLIGVAYGAHVERQKCRATIDSSIKAARDKDAEIARDASANAARQRIEADARAGAVEKEVKSYVEELAKRTASECRVGDDAARFNDGLRMRDDEVQQPREEPAARGGHRSEPGTVPARKGKR